MASVSQSQSDETPTVELGTPSKVLLTQNFCHGGETVGQFALPFDFVTAYHLAMEPIARSWDKRQKSHRKTAWYASHRARALRFDPYERMAICGSRWTTIKCGCRHVRVPVRCGLRWLCPKCRKATYGRFFRRARKAMNKHQALAARQYVADGSRCGQHPEWKLVTLTVRHTGDLRLDRARIVSAWKRFRQWVWTRIGKFPFVMAWELTAGADGRGHVHAHVSVLWPYVDYTDARSEWRRAILDDGALIHFESARKGAGGAAHYLAKYASKSLEVSELPPVLAASAIAANYGKRLINASHHFWLPRDPRCPTCREYFVLAQRPPPLREVAPFGSWRAIARKYGVDSYRGPPL